MDKPQILIVEDDPSWQKTFKRYLKNEPFNISIAATYQEALALIEAQTFDWVEQIPDNPYPFPHYVTLQFPGSGTLTVAEVPQSGHYALSNMQVWSEPPAKPDHDFICFEPSVGSEDALNRPADRLNIDQHSSTQIVLQLQAKPL